MTNINLKEFDFGPYDANYDNNLFEYFVLFNDVSSILDKENLIVVGVKGSGKSAIKKYIKERRDKTDDFTIVIDDSYGFRLNNLEGHTTADFQQRIAKFLNSIIVDWLINYGDFEEDSISSLENLVESDPLHKRILDRLKIKAGYEGIASAELSDIHPIIFGENKSKRGNKDFYKIINEILDKSGKDIWVLFDDIDKIFTSDDVDINAKFMEGLIYSSTDLVLRDYNKKVFVVLFIRAEIYDELERYAVELDKRLQYIWHINWKDDELVNFLSERIKWNILEKTNNNDEVDEWEDWKCWKTIFDADDKKETEAIQDYMLNRVVNGPRDLLLIVDNSRKAATSEGADKISMDHVIAQEGDYGEEKLKQISRNFIHVYPEINRLLEYLFHETKKTFTLMELNTMRMENILLNDDVKEMFKDASWINKCTKNSFVRILYKVGFVGYFDNVKKSFIYFLEKAEPGKALLESDKLKIHPAFHSYLNID